MTSTETSNFLNNLNEILCELNVRHRDKSTLKLFYLNERLNKSLSTYYHEITKTFEDAKAATGIAAFDEQGKAEAAFTGPTTVNNNGNLPNTAYKY